MILCFKKKKLKNKTQNTNKILQIILPRQNRKKKKQKVSSTNINEQPLLQKRPIIFGRLSPQNV
jgi:hypothetical protein